MAQMLRFGQIGLALPQRVFSLFALRDVLACDQDDELAVGAPQSLGVFAHPQHRTVLPDLSNFPSMRLAGRLQAHRNTLTDELSIFFEKNLLHGLTNQVSDR